MAYIEWLDATWRIGLPVNSTVDLTDALCR